MLTLSLEPTDEFANPFFKDVTSCNQWLGQFQLTNLQLAHSLLLTQINEFNRYPVRGIERFNTLELLRETVSYVQDNYAKKIIGKPLPLNENELMVFIALVQLWQVMVQGYQRCLQAYIAGDKQLVNQGALLCQRCLVYSGMELFTYLRSGYEFDPKLWIHLHELYSFAEEQNFHKLEVSDPLNPKYPNSNCCSVYVQILLACYVRPAELNRSQLQMLDIWLSHWSGRVTVERSYTIRSGDVPPLAVDLVNTHGLLPVSQIMYHNTVRYLTMVELSKLLREKIVILQQEHTLQPSDLCELCTRQDCIELLNYLHQCLCENVGIRFSQRRQVAQDAQCCYRPESIYAHLSGKLFQQPRQVNSLDETARKQIEVFGRVLQNANISEQPEIVYPLETWQFEDESISGARLIREGANGGRLSNKQLFALRPSDAKTFILGITVWTHMTHSGQLRIGVRYLPGSAEAIRIRVAGINMNMHEKYVPAFLLAAVEVLNSPPSLIIPHDWLHTARIVEILHQNGEKEYLKTGFCVTTGVDFERFSFKPVNFSL